MTSRAFGILVLCGLIGLVAPGMAQDASAVLERMAAGVKERFSYESSWRQASPFRGPREKLDELIRASDRVEWFEDPRTGEDLWTLREGMTIVDGEREEAAIVFWPTYENPTTREESRIVRIYRPDTYIAIMGGTTPARIVEGSGRTADEVLAQRRRGQRSAGDTVLTADFLCFVRRAVRLLRDAPDLEIVSADRHTATITSKRLGLTCTVDLDTGECVSGSFSTPDGRTSTWEVLDWFPERMFPGRHPSLVRRTWQVEGRELSNYTIYDRVRRVADVSSALRWQSYREIGWDRIRNSLVSADGTVLKENAAPKGAASLVPSRTRGHRTNPVTRWSTALVISGAVLLIILIARRWRSA